MRIFRTPLCILLLVTAGDLLVSAQEVNDSFQFDPVEYYGAKFLTWTLIAGVVVAAYSLSRVIRGHTRGTFFRSLLVTSVVMLPLLSLSTGTLLVFDRAERVEFCGSCHLTMKAYVEDMENPQSEGLAAIHYKNRYIHANQCYECHTSYGMFGDLQAKMAGTVDVYRYYTRTYKSPLKMRLPYPNGDCLKCHAQSAKWLGREEHVDAKQALFAEDVRCLDCHGVERPAHPVLR